MAKDHVSSRDGFTVRNVPEGTPPEKIKELADRGRAQGLKEIEFKPESSLPLGVARSAAQGLTLGWSDEAEAALRSRMGDMPYEQVRDQIRQEQGQFSQEYPKTAIASEIGGALAPAIATRGRVRPSLGRVASYGAGGGAVAGAGYSENANPLEVAVDAGVGLATGGAISAGMYKGMQAGGALFGKAFDWAKNKLGAQGSDIVRNEVLRMAEATGQTPDEIVAAVARGEIMADNKTLREALRSFYAKGDDKLRNEIDTVLSNRAESTRLEGVASLQRGLAPNAADSNMTRVFNADDDAFKAMLIRAYDDVIGSNPVEVPQMQGVMLEAINRLPNAMDAITLRYKAAGNLVPPFKVTDNGAVEWTRIPTIKDAEILRRTLDKEAGKFFRSGDGDIGTDLVSVERMIRSGIDDISPDLASTRSQWRQLETNREAFKLGKTIFSKPSEDMEILAADMMNNPMAMQYMRQGFMSAINNKMTVGGRKSLASKLSDPETKEGKAFRALFPEDQRRDTLNKLLVSAKAQETSNRVLGGSQTAPTAFRAERIGRNVTPEDIAGTATGNPISMLNLATKLIPTFKEMPPEAQRQVVGIMMEQDPRVLQAAFSDRDARQALIDSIMRKAAMGTGAISTTQSDALQGM